MHASTLLLCVSQFPKFSAAVWSSVPSAALLHHFPRFFIRCFILNMLCRWQQYHMGKRQPKSSLEKLRKPLRHTQCCWLALQKRRKMYPAADGTWLKFTTSFERQTQQAKKLSKESKAEIYIKLGWKRKRHLSCSNNTDICFVVWWWQSIQNFTFPCCFEEPMGSLCWLIYWFLYLVFTCTWLNSFLISPPYLRAALPHQKLIL